MPIDTGTVVIVAAVLLFYLRLILIQRERLRRLRTMPKSHGPGKKMKGKARQQEAYSRFSILSTRRQDWLIAGAGVLAVLAGVLLYLKLIPWPAAQAAWWLPVAVGIVAFSWAFR
jgi:hypothetical protein